MITGQLSTLLSAKSPEVGANYPSLPDDVLTLIGDCDPTGLRQQFTIDIARSSLKDFIYQSWHLVEPTTPLLWNWHLDVLCSTLEKVTAGEIKRLIITIPPGTMKSLIVSVFWPAWEWTNDSSKRYLLASYTDVNTIRDNLRCRDIVTSEWYRTSFNVELSSEQAAKIRFDTLNKGWRIATSVGGAATGWHPDRIVLDDLLKAEDVQSEVKIATCNQWLSRTISTRIARDPAVILVMQRLHMNDAVDYLKSKWDSAEIPYTHINFPMRYKPYRPATEQESEYIPDQLDIRTTPGELLWPEKWPEEKVRGEEILLGPFGTSSQLQQEPIPEGGGLFKREQFKFVDAAPVKARRCRGWDIAETENGGNFTVGTKLAVTDDGLIYIEHSVRAQLGPGGVDSLIKSIAETDGRDCMIREGSGSGKATIESHAKMLAGYDYLAMPETSKTGSKVSRAKPFRSQCEVGNVFIVRGIWNEAYLSVMCAFPVGKYDDDVDSTSNAYNGLVIAPGEKVIEGNMRLTPSWQRGSSDSADGNNNGKHTVTVRVPSARSSVWADAD